MQRFGFQPAKPAPTPPASDTPHLNAGLELIVKNVAAPFAEGGLGEPTREEVHAVAMATTAASTAALRAAIETAIELRAAK